MNDFSLPFHASDSALRARPRARLMTALSIRPAARAAVPMRPGALARQAHVSHAQACARGEIACRVAWQRLCQLGSVGVLALGRAAGAAPGQGGAMQSLHGFNALAAIAAEVEHALAHGARAGSARAIVLLAALAEARFDGADAARAMAAVAVLLAGAGPERLAVAYLHAALLQARQLPYASCLQAFAPAPAAADGVAAVLWAGLRLAAGVALPDILRSLEQAMAHADSAADGAEIAARVAVLRALVVPQAAVLPAPPAAAGFAAWSLRLQLAWFDGKQSDACQAALAAAPLAGPLTPAADLLMYHLFAALALAWDAAPQHRHALRWHRAELARAAARCAANGAAMAALAGAVQQASEGDVAAALRAYEAAAVTADLHGQTWLAALAWELAAALCQQCGLGAAMPAYRRRALMAWHGCGAHGRIARLCQHWQQDGEPGLHAGLAAPASTFGWPAAEQTDQPDQQDELRRLARAGTVGELGVSIAHEVNQPLAAILLQAAAARRWLRRPRPDLDKALEALEQIAVSGRRAGDIVRSVQGLARRHATGMGVFAVDCALEEALRLLGGALRKHGVRAALALALPNCQIHANRAQVQQVVINLLMNAIDALAPQENRARELVLASRRIGPDSIEISVTDNGPGIAPPDREHIFEALFSTKVHGTGVGLSISRAIAEAHGGQLAFRPGTPHGAVFALVLAAPEATSIA